MNKYVSDIYEANHKSHNTASVISTKYFIPIYLTLMIFLVYPEVGRFQPFIGHESP